MDRINQKMKQIALILLSNQTILINNSNYKGFFQIIKMINKKVDFEHFIRETYILFY